MPTPNYTSLNAKIKSAGASWVAGETPYSRYFNAKATGRLLGVAHTPEGAFAELSAARTVEQSLMAGGAPALPKRLDWRDHEGQNWITPIRDQGRCGASVAFATCATLESRVLIQHKRPGVNFDLSEASLFYCGTRNACSRGWQPSSAFAFAQSHGVGEEKAFAYTPGNQAGKPVPAAVKAGTPTQAGTTRVRKQALQEGPVVAAMAVYGDFFAYQSGVYRHVAGNLSGYHAVCVIGYDDDAGHWIAKNSWNTSWGMQGFFLIRYGECGIDTQFPFEYPASVMLQPGATIP